MTDRVIKTVWTLRKVFKSPSDTFFGFLKLLIFYFVLNFQVGSEVDL